MVLNLKKSFNQLKSNFFAKDRGGSMVSGMLPLLLTIIFLFMTVFIIMDYYGAVQLRHTMENDLQNMVDNAALDGRVSDDLQTEITDYLKNSYNVNPDTVVFDGSSAAKSKNGDYMELLIKCDIPLESRYFFNSYNMSLHVKCRSAWTGA